MIITYNDVDYVVSPPDEENWEREWTIFNAITGDRISGDLRKSLKSKYQEKKKHMDTSGYIDLGAPLPCGTTLSMSNINEAKSILKKTCDKDFYTQYVAPTFTPSTIQGMVSTVIMMDSFGTLNVPTNEKDNTMRVYSNNAEQFAIEQRNYIAHQLDLAATEANTSLTKFFAIFDDAAPATPKEFVDRILAGKYILPKNRRGDDLSEDTCDCYDDDFCYQSPAQMIIWRDPAKKADRDGYDAAVEDMNAAKKAANEVVMLGTLEEARKALEDFRAKTFH